MNKKLLFFVLFISCVLIALVSFLLIKSDDFLNNYSRQAIHYFTQKGGNARISLKKIDFENASLNPINTATWTNISAEVKLNKKSGFFAVKHPLFLNIKNARLALNDLSAGTFSLQATGISLIQSKKVGNVISEAVKSELEAVRDARLEMTFSLPLFTPDKVVDELKNIYSNLSELIDVGKTTVTVDFSGVSSFLINGEPVQARIFTERQNGESVVVMNKESIEIISWLLHEKLTEPEVELLSEKPFHAPKLLKIRDEAQTKSINAHQKNKSVPEDAYRHVLWSYLLTKEYGADFAKFVTDAHELGLTDNTEAEQRMDYLNNEIGRKYALHRYKKDEILDRVMMDPSVVRQPD